MPITTSQQKFFDSAEGIAIKEALRDLQADERYQTDDSYSSNSTINPGNNISFVDKHMRYLSEHTKVNPQQYVSNLRLMTRIRTK